MAAAAIFSSVYCCKLGCYCIVFTQNLVSRLRLAPLVSSYHNKTGSGSSSSSSSSSLRFVVVVVVIVVRHVKASRPVWPRGQIIRPRPRPRSIWPRPRPRPRCIWPRPHRSWPRGLEICRLHGLVNNLIFSLPYSQSNHQRSFLLCIGYLLKTMTHETGPQVKKTYS